MKPRTLLSTPLFLLALGLAGTVHAQQKLISTQSEIAFVSRQMGVPVEGRFRQFDARIAFDPAKPAAAQVAFTIDVGSATLGARETDAELPKPAWFHTARFPQATFQSTAVRATGPGQYEVAGRLTIKGVASDVVVPVRLSQPQGPAGVTLATGQFPIQRLTFKVGENEWADTSMVANEVQVRFRLALTGVGTL